VRSKVLGALRWLGLERTTETDVVRFVRSTGRSQPHITYGNFIELLSHADHATDHATYPDSDAPDSAEGLVRAEPLSGAPTAVAAVTAPARAQKLAKVDSAQSDRLRELWTAGVQAERQRDEQLEGTIEQLAPALAWPEHRPSLSPSRCLLPSPEQV